MCPYWSQGHQMCITHHPICKIPLYSRNDHGWTTWEGQYLNKVTKVLPMPQKYICTKQQALSSHRWVLIIDFAASFYAVEIDPESHPYTAFYVPGGGYFVYCQMPFSFTGAPSCFNEVMECALHELVDTMIQLCRWWCNGWGCIWGQVCKLTNILHEVP